MSSEAAILPAMDNQLQPPSTQATAPSKPPVSIQPGSHLDPGAYVRGSFPISIGADVLVHPRAYLLSIHSPLIIGDGCVVSEKCVLGGPLPSLGRSEQPSGEQPSSEQTRRKESLSMKATVVEDLVHLHANVTIGHGATIGAGAVIESNVVVESDAVIGSHSKICANITVADAIDDWTVVYGSNNNRLQRKRLLNSALSRSDSHQIIENERIRSMKQARDGSISILRMAASKTLTSGARSKR